MRRLLLTVLLAIAIPGCDSPAPGPETEIRSLLQAAEQAAQEHDLGLFKDHLASGYTDRHGNDREAFINHLRLLFLRYRQPHLLTRIETIHLPSPRRAEVTLWLGSADSSRLSLDSHRVELILILNKNEWQVLHADWRRAAPGLY